MKTKQVWRNRIIGYDTKPADQFTGNPLNFRRHPVAQREALRGLLGEVGWVGAVIENVQTGNLIDGHARIEESLSKGDKTPIPFLQVDLTPEEEKLVLASFDPISQMATADKEVLDMLLHEVQTGDAAVQAMLANLAEENGLYFGEEKQAEPEGAAEELVDRAAELQEKWQVKRGDLYTIGKHKLLCGDSTSAENVARLMDGKKADMVFCDPPYGIKIVAANGYVGGGEAYDIPFGGRKGKGLGSPDGAKPFGGGKVRGSVGASNMIEVGKYAPIIGDNTTETAVAAYSLAAGLFPKAVHIWWGGNYYADALPPSPCWIVWDKENTGNFADAELAWTNQTTAVRIFKHMWNGLMKASERGERRVHPTQKPIALAEWCFEKYGKPGDIVLDQFLGSGMSMTAGERTGRGVFGVEMSEEYCAVILQRMSDLGLSPKKLEEAVAA